MWETQAYISKNSLRMLALAYYIYSFPFSSLTFKHICMKYNVDIQLRENLG